MFLDKSRYAKIPKDQVTTFAGRKMMAIRLRRLPAPPATPVTVNQNDRLDLLAQRHLGDSTRFWHIADANTKLAARDLVSRVLDTVKIPTS